MPFLLVMVIQSMVVMLCVRMFVLMSMIVVVVVPVMIVVFGLHQDIHFLRGKRTASDVGDFDLKAACGQSNLIELGFPLSFRKPKPDQTAQQHVARGAESAVKKCDFQFELLVSGRQNQVG
jgi:hypothetical protein